MQEMNFWEPRFSKLSRGACPWTPLVRAPPASAGFKAQHPYRNLSYAPEGSFYTCSINCQLSEDLCYRVLEDDDDSIDDVSLKVRVYSHSRAKTRFSIG